jgi:glutamate N-acetyltransferase/amino-acid N-acetyltransferase
MKVPLGYRFAAGYAGVRKKKLDDLALMVSDEPASAAGVFTQNQVRAAPVLRSEKHLSSSGGVARAIIVNAGNANCATPDGDQVARKMAQLTAKLAKSPREQILVSSTGVIGEPLPISKIEERLPALWEELAPDGFEKAARAIMTTDTKSKTAYGEVETEDGVIRIAGMCKGSGMIMPNMATMLAYIGTDAGVATPLLQRILGVAADKSFNRITIDGDTSTNDSCMLIATGQSGVTVDAGNPELLAQFTAAVESVLLELSHAIVRDGEGATKFVTVQVEQARTRAEALQTAYTIAHSPLVKTALFASDPNWGRILAAVGRAGIDALDLEALRLYLGDVCIVEHGGRSPAYTEEAGQQVMQQQEILIRVVLARGDATETVWTTDFSEEYVRINADYRS